MDQKQDVSVVTVCVVFLLLFALLFATWQYYEEHGRMPSFTTR